MLLALLGVLLGCGGEGFSLDGVWRFEIDEQAPAADRCEQIVLHNALGLLTAEELAEEQPDDGWEREESATQSPWTGLGRIAAQGEGWLLVLGGALLVQEAGAADSAISFAWEQREASAQSQSHPLGYSWSQELDASRTVRVQLGLPTDQEVEDARRAGTELVLEGSFQQLEATTSAWEESDQWPEELGLGETGSLPMGSYLFALDEAGQVLAGSNTRAGAECNDVSCVLSVTASCQDTWTLRAQATDIDPDELELDGAGWDAGI